MPRGTRSVQRCAFLLGRSWQFLVFEAFCNECSPEQEVVVRHSGFHGVDALADESDVAFRVAFVAVDTVDRDVGPAP